MQDLARSTIQTSNTPQLFTYSEPTALLNNSQAVSIVQMVIHGRAVMARFFDGKEKGEGRDWREEEGKGMRGGSKIRKDSQAGLLNRLLGAVFHPRR